MEWWHSLLISIGGALAVGFLYYLLQIRRLRSATAERLSRARSELIDIVELDVINGQEISWDILFRLIRATSRAHNVDLERVCDPFSLAEDVELKLEANRYLDADKKQGYINSVRTALESMLTPEEPELLRQPKELGQLKDAITTDDKEQALQIIESISKLPSEREEELSKLTEKAESRRVQLMALVAGILTAILGAAAALISYYFR